MKLFIQMLTIVSFAATALSAEARGISVKAETYSGGVDTYTCNGKIVAPKANPLFSVENSFAAHDIKDLILIAADQTPTCYQIDVCTRGSQMNYFDPAATYTPKTSNWMSAELIFTDKAYVAATKPSVKATIVCDVQGEGEYKFGHNGSTSTEGAYDTLDTDIDWDALKDSQKGLSDFFFASDEKQFSTYKDSFQTRATINEKDSHYPRFCIVRYEVCERPTGKTIPDAKLKIKTLSDSEMIQ